MNDIRLRILRRVLEIGSSDKHCIEVIFSTDGDTTICIHDARPGHALIDQYVKRDNVEETSAFIWLDEWGTVIRRERGYATY